MSLNSKEHVTKNKSQKYCTTKEYSDEKQMKDRRCSLKYTDFIANHPLLSIVFTIVIHLSIILTTVLLIIHGHDVFPIYFDYMPLFLHDDNTNTQDLAWRFSPKYKNKLIRPVVDTRPPDYNGEIMDTIEVILEGSDMFSAANLKLLNETEHRLFSRINSISSCCFVNLSNKCEPPVSILRMFDGTYSDVDPIFTNASFSNAVNVICQSTMFNQTRDIVKSLLDKNYKPCGPNSKSTRTRLLLLLGWLLQEPYNDDKMVDFLIFQIKPELEKIKSELFAYNIATYYYSTKMYLYDIEQEAYSTMKLAAGSFCFIFMFMWFQTASIWITFFGILSIITSFLLTNLIYRFILEFHYFGFFHILSIFVILGIGSDDVFIFYDTWKLSEGKVFPSNSHRLSDCYQKAAKTTFVTSVTTMAAFIVNASSPLLPVSSFGIFTGMLIGVNYIFDVLFCPIVIFVYSEIIHPFFFKLFCRNRNRKDDKESVHLRSITYHSEDTELRFSPLLEKKTKCESQNKSNMDEKCDKMMSERYHIQTTTFDKRNKINSFLMNGFSKFIMYKPIRIILPLVFTVKSLFFIYSCTTLVPDNKEVEVFKESHNYAKAQILHYNGFQSNYEDSKHRNIHLIWGLKPQNMKSCNWKSGERCEGHPEQDGSFNLSSAEAQIAMMNVCHRLESLTDDEIDRYKIRRNSVTNKPEIACFMSALYKYVQDVISSLSFNKTCLFPFTKDSVTDFMQRNAYIYENTSLPEDFDRYLEILISFWLSNGYTYIPTDDYWIYNNLIGEMSIPGVTKFINNTSEYGMMYGTKLMFVCIEINTTFYYHNLGFTAGKPIYTFWENFIKEEVSKMPDSLKGGFQSMTGSWHWIKIQETLVNSAKTGLVIGISLAFPILTITTFNIIIGFLATVCIALVAAVVVGIIPLVGWKLGVLESINLSLVVGLSVDYIVHLAEAYRTSPMLTREGRVQNMLESMGISVLSGAITTFGAATFMLFSQIQFAYQFGIFVMSTVSISVLFSFFFFSAFMASWGPQRDTGSITSVKWIKDKLCIKTKV